MADLREIWAGFSEVLRQEKADIGSVWVHRKGGQYVITHVALLESTLDPVIIYAPAGGLAQTWVRPAEEFFDGRYTRL